MGRIVLAMRAFFLVLFDRRRAELVRQTLLTGETPPAAPPVAKPDSEPRPVVKTPARAEPPVRSEALSLLAALQREARLIDFLQEPIAEYNDAQIGAAVRDIHRDAGSLIERMFALRPAVAEAEGVEIQVPAGFDAARYRLTGNVAGQPPYRGRLCHPGWEAGKCELPAWTGGTTSARVIAAAEIEVI